jgi:hypothetical protein
MVRPNSKTRLLAMCAAYVTAVLIIPLLTVFMRGPGDMTAKTVTTVTSTLPARDFR